MKATSLRLEAGGQWRQATDCGLRAASLTAFTLIEILVVVAIMSIVLTISVPFMNMAITGNKGINGAMRLVQEACADARALAILRQSTATLVINSDGTLNVQEGGGSGGRGRAESLNVAGNEWRMADRSPESGKARGGRVEMRNKYPAKWPEGVGVDKLLQNGYEWSDAEQVEVQFYANGTSDEFAIIFSEPSSGEKRYVWLEITTGLPDFETDESKFQMH